MPCTRQILSNPLQNSVKQGKYYYIAELQRIVIVQTLPDGSSGIWGMIASSPVGLGAGAGDKARTETQLPRDRSVPWTVATPPILTRHKLGVLRHSSCPQTEMGNKEKEGFPVETREETDQGMRYKVLSKVVPFAKSETASRYHHRKQSQALEKGLEGPADTRGPTLTVYCVPGTGLRLSVAVSLQPSDIGSPVPILQRNSERLINLQEAAQLGNGSTGI